MASIGIETLCVAAIGGLVGLILGAALGAGRGIDCVGYR